MNDWFGESVDADDDIVYEMFINGDVDILWYILCDRFYTKDELIYINSLFTNDFNECN